MHYFVLHASPLGCLANVMALRLIEPHALTHSMLSALMSMIASHANTIRYAVRIAPKADDNARPLACEAISGKLLSCYT